MSPNSTRFVCAWPSRVRSVAVGKGWRADGTMLLPTPSNTTKPNPTGLQQLRQLTDYIVYLEQK